MQTELINYTYSVHSSPVHADLLLALMICYYYKYLWNSEIQYL